MHSISEYAGSENFGVGKIANFQKMGSSMVNIYFWWVGVSYSFVAMKLRYTGVPSKIGIRLAKLDFWCFHDIHSLFHLIFGNQL